MSSLSMSSSLGQIGRSQIEGRSLVVSKLRRFFVIEPFCPTWSLRVVLGLNDHVQRDRLGGGVDTLL